MSSWLRLSIFMVLVLATVALGFIAYTVNMPPKPVAQAPAVEQKAPEGPKKWAFVAARPLPTGTSFLRDNIDFKVREAKSDDPPAAIHESLDDKFELNRSVVRRFVDDGNLITGKDILRPSEWGFVASVLAPDTRAISINVDPESGVSGLIWPGDYVDVLWTQTSDNEDRAKHRLSERASDSLSEILVHNVRIIAIDQEVVEGVPGANAAANKIVEGVAGDNAAANKVGEGVSAANAEPRKVARSVSLELSPEQVKKITLAKELGKLSLAVRSVVEIKDRANAGDVLAVQQAVESKDTADAGAVFGFDVSPAIARQVARRIARNNAELDRKKAELDKRNAEAACKKFDDDKKKIVEVYAKGKHESFVVRKQGGADAELALVCDSSVAMARMSEALAEASGEEAKE